MDRGGSQWNDLAMRNAVNPHPEQTGAKIRAGD
jgi:hypothetical protein